jgi:hypothetical protein
MAAQDINIKDLIPPNFVLEMVRMGGKKKEEMV